MKIHQKYDLQGHIFKNVSISLSPRIADIIARRWGNTVLQFRNTTTNYITKYTFLRTHACVELRLTLQMHNVVFLQFRMKTNEANVAF